MCGIKWMLFGFFSFAFLLIHAVNGITDSRIDHYLVDDEQPSFGASITNTSVPIGREAALSCSVKNLGNFKVGWMRASDQTVLALGNRVVTHNSRYAVTHDDAQPGVWTLKIKTVRESDRGCYMCQINTTPMQKQLGCVDIYLPPDISDEESSSDLTIKEGENASLYCHAHGHPTPRITWRRNDGTPIWLSSSSSSSSLPSTTAQSVNNKNASGTTTAAKIAMKSSSTIKVDTFSGNYLNLTHVQREQMGAYLCIASNDIPPAISKRVVLNVQFPPNASTPRALFGSYVESDVTVECIIEAFPLPVNYWIKGTKPLKAYDIDNYYNANSMNHIGGGMEQQQYQPGSKDEVISLSEADDGTYTCISTNTLGKANKTIRIYAMKRPTTTTTTTTPEPTTTTTRVYTTTTTTVPTTRSTPRFTTSPPSTSTTTTENYLDFAYTNSHYLDHFMGDNYVNQHRAVHSPPAQTGGASSPKLLLSNCLISIMISTFLQR